ncbi:hypothetical protein JCM10212_004400 [Sporobolomyces blumeae]
MPSTSFYKRPLPHLCTPFNSPRGKLLFENAHLDQYFLLAQHFLTQNEPAYCALGTLAMILNALEMDPQRVWKGPWRFFDQDMLDCCRPLSDIAQVGLTLSEFTCLARCNGLVAQSVSPPLPSDRASSSHLASSPPSVEPGTTTATDEATREAALARFRRDLVTASTGGRTVMAISYDRKTLGQTGTGHFSPVGAYSERDDMLLILDVARFKYPSYWIPTELAYDAMVPLDKATGQPRGYVMLQVAPALGGRGAGTSLDGLQSATSLTLNKSSWAILSNSLSRLILETKPHATLASFLERVVTLVSELPTRPVAPRTIPELLPEDESALRADDASSVPRRRASPEEAIKPLLSTLSSSPLASLFSGGTTTTTSPTSRDDCTDPVDPYSLLFLFVVFSPRSPLTALVPRQLSTELDDLFRLSLSHQTPQGVPHDHRPNRTGPPSADTNAGNFVHGVGPALNDDDDDDVGVDPRLALKREVDFLAGQLGALGECCRAEEEGSGCGCASKKAL